MSWMITATGREYHLSGPGAWLPEGRPVRIEDIAHQLSIITRFHGATSRPYSVAEHSLLCSEIAQRSNASLTVQMAALLHDAHEIYTNDLSSPGKRAVNRHSVQSGGTQAWHTFEAEHAQAVRKHFGLLTVFTSHRAVLREIDLMALATERRDLTAWNPDKNTGWQELNDDAVEWSARILPVEWLRLNTPERDVMAWTEWRSAFQDRFDEISFGLDLQRCGEVVA